MKLGKDRANRIAGIPDLYRDNVLELLDWYENQKLKGMSECPEDQLVSRQKAVQAVKEIKKLLEAAPKELSTYK